MRFKVGDKVFIKPFEEICEEPGSTIRETDGSVMAECYVETDKGVVITHDVFLPDMKKYCEKQYIIQSISEGRKYIFKESGYNFLECWLTDEPHHYVDSFKEK